MAKSDENIKTAIEISGDLRGRLDALVEKNGTTRPVFMTRCAEWFLRQDDTFISLVMQKELSTALDALTASRFANLKDIDPDSLSFDESMKVIELLMARLRSAHRSLKRQAKSD